MFYLCLSTHVAQAESIDYIDMRLERLCSDWLNSCSALMYQRRGGGGRFKRLALHDTDTVTAVRRTVPFPTTERTSRNNKMQQELPQRMVGVSCW